MKEKSDYSPHMICLTALFVLGNAVISAPYSGADDETFLAFIISAAVSVAIIFPISFFINRLLEFAPNSTSRFKKIIFKAAYIIICVLVLLDASLCFADYVRFVSSDMLPEAYLIPIIIVFALCVVWAALQKGSMILKFSLFAFVVTATVCLSLFAVSFKRLEFENIFLLRFPSAPSLLKQTFAYFKNVFLAAIPVLIYNREVFGRIKKRNAALGFTLGSAVLSLCLMCSLLLFGAPLSSELEFPYAAAVSTVTIGNIFTRMDGFAYFIYFASCIIKVSICIIIVKELLKKIGFRFLKTTVWASATVVALAGWLF